MGIILNIFTILGAVGLFLYGMKVMSEGLQKVAGDRMRSILSAMTSNRFSGVFIGILITALIQSSSASTVMVVSFVNAGLMSLEQSMAVIMGANVGTTFTAWIIALFGVKVNISVLVLPLIGIAIPMMFSQRSKRKSVGELILGFAFLFMGLDTIGHSVPELSPDMLEFLAQYSNLGFFSVSLFVLVGLVVTMVIQSSAATFAIVLVMCSKGWIDFNMACAVVLGSNIGTTITPMLASLSANLAAKKAALGHLMFNLFGTLWTVVLFFPFCQLVVWITESLGQGNPLVTTGEELALSVSFGLSIFHTVFNIVNLCVMIWFTKGYVKVVNFLLKANPEEDEMFQLKYISSGILSASELSILQAKKEILLYAERTHKMFGIVQELYDEEKESEITRLFARIEKYESISDRIEMEIANYLTKVAEGRLSDESKTQMHHLFRLISEIESIGDSCYNMGRTILRREEKHITFTKEIDANVRNMMDLLEQALVQMETVLHSPEGDSYQMNKAINIEHEINVYRNQLKTSNIIAVNQRAYDYETSILYMDFVTECEKAGDYIINVVEAHK